MNREDKKALQGAIILANLILYVSIICIPIFFILKVDIVSVLIETACILGALAYRDAMRMDYEKLKMRQTTQALAEVKSHV